LVKQISLELLRQVILEEQLAAVSDAKMKERLEVLETEIAAG
jgi:hypothetical protein